MSRSARPRNAASSPIGSSSGATPAPSRSRSWSRVRGNEARSRSSLLTKTMRGRPELGGRLPEPDRLHLGPGHRAHHEHREVGHPQRRQRLALEVGVARRVEEVDAVALPHDRGQRQRQRLAAPLLLGLAVAHRRAVLDPAEPRHEAGLEQHGLGQRGLAGAAVADQRHVADPFGRDHFHEPTPCVGCCRQPAGAISVGGSPRVPGCPGTRVAMVPIRDPVGLPFPGHRPALRDRIVRSTHARRTLQGEHREGVAAHRAEPPQDRHHRRPPHHARRGHGGRRGGGHRHGPAAGRPAPARPHRSARRPRRRGGQGLRHRRPPGRLLRLGVRPRLRLAAARRRGLVPGQHPSRATSRCCRWPCWPPRW